MPNDSGEKAGLSFVTLMAYDYAYALKAVRSYYEIADEIILGVDADRISYTHKPFEMDMGEVRRELEKLDVRGIVRVVEGNFHREKHPLDNETRERSELSMLCAEGNWIVQIDSDEMLLNAREFRNWLIPADADACVWAKWISVFKTFGDRALVIHPANESTPVATKWRGAYTAARRTNQPGAGSPLQMLHFSWGRSGGELRQKLENWSHSWDFDLEGFYRLWESVTLQNYGQFRNFHPNEPALWPGLAVVEIKGPR
jgi:hypothetical protein